MKNRDDFHNTTAQRAEKSKNLHESDKAFDESMVSLMVWLREAIRQDYLTKEETLKIFQEELKARRGYD